VGQGAGSRRPGGGPAKVRLTCRCAPQRVFGESEYRRLFETFAQENAQAIVVSKGAENIAQRHLIVELAERAKLRAIYAWRKFVDVGGLMSYGNGIQDGTRRIDSPLLSALHAETEAGVRSLSASLLDEHHTG
jgi:hypothetical protein